MDMQGLRDSHRELYLRLDLLEAAPDPPPAPRARRWSARAPARGTPLNASLRGGAGEDPQDYEPH
eukprot:11288761-Alexandrium_andersonii.AAC.1